VEDIKFVIPDPICRVECTSAFYSVAVDADSKHPLIIMHQLSNCRLLRSGKYYCTYVFAIGRMQILNFTNMGDVAPNSRSSNGLI
jgi:hypothetical protein